MDNVAESGEESEDEWNYYRVEPTGDKESAAPQESDSGATEEDMESQLNPNAAVFIPSSPTENSNHIEQPFNENLTQEEFFNKENVMSSSFIAHEPVSNNETSPIEAINGKDEEVWLSSSPKKGGVPLDNVSVPPEDEFDREVSQRPGDLDAENHVNGINLANGHKNSDGVTEAEGIVTVLENSNNPFNDSEFGKVHGYDEGSILDKEPQSTVTHSDEIPASTEATSLVESDSTEMEQERIESAEPVNSADLDIPLQSDTVEPLGESNPAETLLIHPAETLACEDPVKAVEILDSAEPDQLSEFVAPAQSFETAPVELDSANSNDFLHEADLLGETESPIRDPVPSIEVDSPIVSGASDLNRDHIAGDFLQPPSDSHGLSSSDCDLSSGPFNDGVCYSTSGLDNIMNAVSVNANASSPSAQSTPFEGETFEFGSKTDNLVQESAQHEQEPFSEVEKGDFIQYGSVIGKSCTETKDDFNEGFDEENANFMLDTTSQNEVKIIPSASDFTEADVVEEFEPIYPVQSPANPSHSTPSQLPFTMDFTSAEPMIPDLCNIPNEENVISSPIEIKVEPQEEPEVKSAEPEYAEPDQQEVEIETAPEAVHDLVNGLVEESAPGPDVLPVSENAVESVTAVDLHAECPPPAVFEAVPDVIGGVPEPALPATEEPQSIAEPADESLSQQDFSIVAAVAAATTAAVAASAVASKVDKKPATKAPAGKPKPTAAKAPVKAATKSVPPTSATVPKKSVVPPVPAARAAPRSTLAPKPKPADVVSKPASTTSKPAPPKPRTTAPISKPPAEKKPLANGDASKPAASKPLARVSTRPATAPARSTVKPALPNAATAPKLASAAPKATTQPPIRRPVAGATSKPKPATTSVTETKTKPAPSVSAAPRPRPSTASSLSSRPAVSAPKAPLASKPIDKQTKETTNKLISATRTTVSRTAATTASKTVPKTTTASAPASSKTVQSKPAPIRRPTATGTTKTAIAAKKPNEKPKAPMTNGVVKNGHASPDEVPHQNGVSHDEPVIDKRESDFKIESLVDNHLVV